MTVNADFPEICQGCGNDPLACTAAVRRICEGVHSVLVRLDALLGPDPFDAAVPRQSRHLHAAV